MFVCFPCTGCFQADNKPNKGVTIHNPHPVDILIGETTAQDVLLDLGSPLRKFVKEDDRMERIWGGDSGSSEENKGSTSLSASVSGQWLMNSLLELLPARP
jgi:hypothetical protein